MKTGDTKWIRRILAAAFLLIVLGAQAVYAENAPDAAAQGQLQGWQKRGEDYFYYNENSVPVIDGFSSDGYYLDRDGRWRYETYELFGQQYKIPDRYMSPAEYGVFSREMSADLDRLRKSLQPYLGTTRVVRAGPDAVIYNSRNSRGEEKTLIGLYKDEKSDGWRLRLAAYLGDKSGRLTQLSTYDFLVLRFMLSRISHVPGYLADVLYDTWQGKNQFRMSADPAVRAGDVLIRVKIVNGGADFYISNAFPM